MYIILDNHNCTHNNVVGTRYKLVIFIPIALWPL